MRQVICELALNGGKSQYQICNEFSPKELTELLIYKNIKFKERSKDDVRFGILSAILAKDKDIDKYIFNWGKEEKISKKEQAKIDAKKFGFGFDVAFKRNKDRFK